MVLNDIKINEQIELTNVELFKKGYLGGYISFMTYDKITDREHESLFRVYDPKNGTENTIVSIDYGWRIENVEIVFNMIEQELIKLVNKLNINKNEFVLE